MLERINSMYPSFSKLGLGKTHLIEPIKKDYPISPAKEALLYEELDRMLKLGVIEESKNPWSSPVATVVKPGKTRICLGSRDLNKLTVKDAYPIPHIEGLLMRLSDTFYISAIDLKDSFWQIPLSKECKEKTALTVFSRTFEEHVKLLERVAKCIQLSGLTINLEKSRFV